MPELLGPVARVFHLHMYDAVSTSAESMPTERGMKGNANWGGPLQGALILFFTCGTNGLIAKPNCNTPASK